MQLNTCAIRGPASLSAGSRHLLFAHICLENTCSSERSNQTPAEGISASLCLSQQQPQPESTSAPSAHRVDTGCCFMSTTGGGVASPFSRASEFGGGGVFLTHHTTEFFLVWLTTPVIHSLRHHTLSHRTGDGDGVTE